MTLTIIIKLRVSYLSWRSIWEFLCNHWGFVRYSEVHLECRDSEPSSLSVFVDDKSRVLCPSGRCSCECSQEEAQPRPTGTGTFSPAEIYLQSAWVSSPERKLHNDHFHTENTSCAFMLTYITHYVACSSAGHNLTKKTLANSLTNFRYMQSWTK